MRGWHRDSYRHYLAAKGVSTKKYFATVKQIKKMSDWSLRARRLMQGLQYQDIERPPAPVDAIILEDNEQPKKFRPGMPTGRERIAVILADGIFKRLAIPIKRSTDCPVNTRWSKEILSANISKSCIERSKRSLRVFIRVITLPFGNNWS